MNLIRLQLAGFDQMLDFGDRDLCRGRHHGIEVPRRLAINQVALPVALPCLHESKVGFQTFFHDVGTAFKLASFLSFSDHRSHTGRRIKSRDSSAAGPNALSKSALRSQIELDGSLEHHFFEQFILADIAADVMHDLTGGQQQAVSDAIDADIIADGAQILCAAADERTNEILWHAAEAKTANHDGRAVKDVANGIIRVGHHFIHRPSILAERLSLARIIEFPLQSCNFHMHLKFSSYPFRNALAAALMLLSSAVTLAQEIGPQLRGKVCDASSKPIVGATVILKAQDQAEPLSAQTGADGTFSFPFVRPASYHIEVSAAGFVGVSRLLGPISAEKKIFELIVLKSAVKSTRKSESANGVTPSSTGPQFFDEPQFTVSGVTDTTNLGGHGSGPFSRNREAVEKDVASLATTGGVSESPRNDDKALRAEVERNPSDFAANQRLGRMLVAEGKARDAIPYLERAKELNSDDYQNMCDLGFALVSAGEYAAARTQLQGLLRKHDTAEVHHLLAGVDEKLGDSLAAVHEYQRAAELAPSESTIFDWGSELLLHHAADPAIEVFIRGNRLFPHSTRMLIGLGAAEFSAGSYEQAVKRLCEASDLNPEDPLPYLFLGKVQRSEKTVSHEVIERLQRFLNLQADNPQANYLYAVAVWKDNQPTPPAQVAVQVESLLKNAVRLDPKFAEAFLQLGIVHAYQENSAVAISDFQHAIANRPDLQEAHYRLAQAYRSAGNLDQAKAEIRIYEQWAQQSAEQIEREHHEIKQFVYSLRDRPSTQVQ